MCSAIQAFCSGWLPSGDRPSMVVMDFPATSDSGIEQERTASPSICTVQAPQAAMPQPNLVPVSFKCSRNTQSSGVSGAASTWCCWPLTVTAAIGRLPWLDARALAVRERPYCFSYRRQAKTHYRANPMAATAGLGLANRLERRAACGFASQAEAAGRRCCDPRGPIVPEKLTDLIEELALANRILAHEGVLDAFGHVSVRHPSDPGRYLLSRARSPAVIEPGDILEYSLDSAPVKPPKVHLYSERVIHGCIFQARPDVMAVCHHHAPAVMPFCIAGKPIVPVRSEEHTSE